MSVTKHVLRRKGKKVRRKKVKEKIKRFNIMGPRAKKEEVKK